MAEQDSNTPPAAAGQAKPKQTDPLTATPHEHAVAIGAFRVREIRNGELAVTSVNGQSVDMSRYSWQHNAAAALHGWSDHEHHAGAPLALSIDDYKKALLAASAPVIRAAANIDAEIKREGGEPVKVSAKKGEALDLRKLGLTTHDLANAGVPFTAAEEPHKPALSPHAAHIKSDQAQKPQTDDSNLFAKA